ncbi:MAG: hypothetical protein JO248_05655 [Acidimicrobiia bacterium]|nr:hypothetical protein [Acidimicrobiia bacterium]
MEHTGVTPAGAISAPDLIDVVLGNGPFLTVYLATEAAIENAAQRSELRWKDLRRDLANQGVDDAILEAVDPLVPDAHLKGECLVVIANASGLLHVSHEPEPPTRDVGRWGAPPMIGPLLEWRQSQVPHVVALVDRKGGDLFVFHPGGGDHHMEAGGADDPIHKAKPGGWSQSRYQRRAENVWEANASDVADALVELVDKEQPRLIAVGGDVRAVELVKQALPARVLDLVGDISGNRTPDGSVDAVAEEVTRLVATAVAADTKDLLAKFREERGQADRAVEGAEDTLAALTRAQVEVLLVHADPDDDRTVWFGPEAIPVSGRSTDLTDLGVAQAEANAGALVDVAIRAALGTGAGIRMIPGAGGPTDGIGAILRWRD